MASDFGGLPDRGSTPSFNSMYKDMRGFSGTELKQTLFNHASDMGGAGRSITARYWLIELRENHGHANFTGLSEAALYEPNNRLNLLYLRKTFITFSSTQGSVATSQDILTNGAYDNNMFCAFGNAYLWFSVDLGRPYTIVRMELAGCYDAGNTSPKTVAVWTSIDGVRWAVIRLFRNIPAWGLSERRVWSFQN